MLLQMSHGGSCIVAGVSAASSVGSNVGVFAGASVSAILRVPDVASGDSGHCSHRSPVGRAQGIYASLDGLNLHVMISTVFTSEAYNGSTMEIQSNSEQFQAVREVFILSRTGMFRYARDYATFETYYLDIPAGYSVIRCCLWVLHCQEYHGV
ncbi:unnamed protein product [Dovyalis caffra]|uniref:Dirigent protein n=1 Tax=Dovyalis caffra TaxID=77055 RepID=A0AAV1SC60_9ROSI|nr:unnamed protein product [Dovyalis caffra]